jgi:hypothetical protein
MSPHDIITKGDNTLFRVGDTLDENLCKNIKIYFAKYQRWQS